MIASKYSEHDLTRFIKLIHEEATKKFLRDGDMDPTLFLLHKDRTWRAVNMSAFSADKEMFGVMVKAHQLDSDVVGTILLSEVWMVEGGEEALNVLPSESPDRIEALFYMAETKFGNLAARAEIVREGKKAVDLKPLEIMADGEAKEATGRLVSGVFNPPNQRTQQHDN
jgi:hypothetical protein